MNIILIATAAVVLIYNLLFFHIGFGIGTGLLFLILNLYFLILRNKQNPRNFNLALLCSGFSILFAFLIGWRDNGLVLFMNLLSSIFFLLSAVFYYQDKSAFHFSIPRFLLTPLALFFNMLGTFLGPKLLPTETTNPKDHSVTMAVIKGFAVALPIFLILLFLLNQADPVFSKMTGDLFRSLGERLIVSAVVLFGLLIFALTRVKETFLVTDEVKEIHKDKVYELLIILGSLAFLFAAFIAVQFQYLFSNITEQNLAQVGIASLTYSEYVRKGFAELLVVSVISISVLVYILHFLHRLAGNQKLSVQLLASVFTIETGLILLSAAQRDLLYAQEHGLTRARVFGFIFLIWLAVFLLLLLVKVLVNLQRKLLFNSILSITVLSLLSFSLVNIDGLIARDYKPTVNKEIDYYYLATLSADAHQSWKPAMEEIDQLLTSLPADGKISSDDYRKLNWATLTLAQINNQLNTLEDKYASDDAVKNKYKENVPENVKNQRNWQSVNLSQYEAYNFVLKEKALFAKIPDFQKKVDDLMKANYGITPTQLDRSVDAPFTQNR